jgi:phytoene dehydrogenase-like protein
MNYCSHWTRFYGHPAYSDFDLAGEGLRYLFPEENEGMIFDDGSSFVGYSAYRVVDAATGRQERSDENIAKTQEQIAGFSARDADTYLDLLDKYERYWKQAYRRHRFSPPSPYGTPDALEELLAVPDSGLEPVHQLMTTRQLAYDFFDSPELRTLFMRACTTSMGCYADDVIGLQGLVHCLALVLSFEPAAIAVGGSQAITDALMSAGRKLGVEYLTRAEADALTVRGSRATGVTLADGSQIATDLVVVDLGLHQTVLRLLRNSPVDAKLVRRIRNIHYDRGTCYWVNLAVRELPAYNAEARNPGVGRQPRLYWGPKDPDRYAIRYQPEVYTRGFADRLYVYCSADTIWDTSRAPDGSHLIGVEEFGPPTRAYRPEEWRSVKEAFGKHLIAEWERYAPNMTPDNVIAMDVFAPCDIEQHRPDMLEGGFCAGSPIASQLGRFRPVAGLTSGYRIVLDNLYCCSSALHSGHGIGRGSSYNCFRQVAEELGLSSNGGPD